MGKERGEKYFMAALPIGGSGLTIAIDVRGAAVPSIFLLICGTPMAIQNWEQLLSDLRGDDVERALAASEEIAAQVTAADMRRVYALAEDEDYFVRVMAGEILARTAGVAALPTLLDLMVRNRSEGLDNDGLDGAVKELIDANPITARVTLEPMCRSEDGEARAVAEWGLDGVPEKSTVVTALVAPQGAKVGRRGCFAQVGVLLLALLLAGAAWSYTPPDAGRDCTRGNHAAWLSVDWTSQPVSREAVQQLSAESAAAGLRYLYPYTTYLKADGTFNPTDTYAAEFVEVLRNESGQFVILAWVGVPLANERGFGVQGWAELSDGATRAAIAERVAALVRDNGFDGVHLNVETVWDDDADFLLLLEEVRDALGKDAILSVTGHHWSPPLIEPLGLRWSSDYYREVAQRVEQIAVMSYDSRAPQNAIYRFWMREQTRGIAASVAPTGVELLMGVSLSDEATATHAPTVETLTDGLAGLCAGGTDELAGVALYAAWEGGEAEWEEWGAWVE